MPNLIEELTPLVKGMRVSVPSLGTDAWLIKEVNPGAAFTVCLEKDMEHRKDVPWAQVFRDDTRHS